MFGSMVDNSYIRDDIKMDKKSLRGRGEFMPYQSFQVDELSKGFVYVLCCLCYMFFSFFFFF